MSSTKWDANGLLDFTDGDSLPGEELNDTLEIGCPPIGSIIAWAKSFTGVPSLPQGWAECDGSVVSDAESPLDGQTLPDLNGTTEADKLFLRGANTSGGTGGSDSHTHSHGSSTTNFTSGITVLTSASATSEVPPHYEVVFIIRVK